MAGGDLLYGSYDERTYCTAVIRTGNTEYPKMNFMFFSHIDGVGVLPCWFTANRNGLKACLRSFWS